MAKWNKKLGLVFLNLGLLTVTPNFANADSCYDPCCDPCSFGGFEIGADFLYWKPCVDNLDYVYYFEGETTSASTPSITERHSGYKSVCLDWEPGFRIRVAKDDVWCDWRLSASYTWLNINNSATSTKLGVTDGEFLISPLFTFFDDFLQNFEVIKGKYDTSYNTWDVLFSYDISCNRCHTFSPFWGVEGLIFNQELSAIGFADVTIDNVDVLAAKWTSDYFGVGLKLGTDYVFQMLDCLKLYASASGSITVGNHDNKLVNTEYDASGNITIDTFKSDDNCQFVPGYHLAVGVLYESDMCGCDYGFRLGWESTEWRNVSNPRQFALFGSSNTSTVGFHGLVAGLDFSF